MRTIYSAYRPPVFHSLEPVGESETVQGLITSLSVILNAGRDDNNMKMQELGYSGDNVVDLYPEVFNRPTKYEMEYLQQQAEHEPGGPSDVPPEQSAPTSPAGSPSEPVSPDATPEAKE